MSPRFPETFLFSVELQPFASKWRSSYVWKRRREICQSKGEFRRNRPKKRTELFDIYEKKRIFSGQFVRAIWLVTFLFKVRGTYISWEVCRIVLGKLVGINRNYKVWISQWERLHGRYDSKRVNVEMKETLLRPLSEVYEMYTYDTASKSRCFRRLWTDREHGFDAAPWAQFESMTASIYVSLL
jgi:hypothetical protein